MLKFAYNHTNLKKRILLEATFVLKIVRKT
jgi:hypothetical protein